MIIELKDHFKFVLPVLCLFLFGSVTVVGQKDIKEIDPGSYENLEKISSGEIYVPHHITKKPGHYTRTDWQSAIDSTWGDGLLKSQKLQILNKFWDTTDTYFACFVNHPDYHAGWWDSLYAVYYNEINV